MMGRERRLPAPRVAILILVVGGLLATSVLPMRRYIDLRGRIASLQEQDRALDRQAEMLRQRKFQLRTPEEIERIAREDLGMVRPGEVPFVVIDPSSTPRLGPPVPAPQAAHEDPGDSSWLTRWWAALRSTVRTVR
ncbi:MAG: septum formation initiator family protein [Actinomycetota bacterium]